MGINNLIANPYMAKPVTNFLAGRRHAEQSNALSQRQDMNALSMRNTNQAMDARQQTMNQAEQENKMKIVAMYMKGVKTQEQYTAATALMKQERGVDSNPTYDDATKQRIANIIEATGMRDETFSKVEGMPGVQKSNISNKRNQYATPADPVQRYGASRPTVADPNRMGQYPVDEQGNETGGKGVNMYNRTDITDTVNDVNDRALTKGATTAAQKKMSGSLGFRDQLSNLYKFSKKNENLHDVGSHLTQIITNYAEKYGIDTPDEWKKESSDWHELNNRTRTVVDAIRAETTKSAASFKELDQFLKPRTPQSDDGLTKFNAKMKGLMEYEESTTIRTKLLLERGFKFGGRSGKGNDMRVLYSDPNGDLQAIEDIMPLSAIPTHNERRADIMQELAGGRKLKDISPDELKSLKFQTINALKNEGYNTVIYGQ